MYSSHFKALFKKNLLILKRNYLFSIVEICSPLIVMILFWRLKALFKIEKLIEDDDDKYIYSNGIYLRNNNNKPSLNIKVDDSYFDSDSIFNFFRNNKNTSDLLDNDLPYVSATDFCSNKLIALIGEDFPEEIVQSLNLSYWELYKESNIRFYESLEELNNYILSDKYDTDIDKNLKICFGISYIKNDNKYTFKIHYFPTLGSKYAPSIPSTTIENLDPFRTQPDFESYKNYKYSGFLTINKLIYDYILKKETNNKDAEINFRLIVQKYDEYLYSIFNNYFSMLFGFFTLVAYALPLSININKLVKEKETKAN